MRCLTWPVKLTGVLGRCAVLGRVRIAGLMGLSMDGPAAYLWALGRSRVWWFSVVQTQKGRRKSHGDDDVQGVRRRAQYEGRGLPKVRGEGSTYERRSVGMLDPCRAPRCLGYRHAPQRRIVNEQHFDVRVHSCAERDAKRTSRTQGRRDGAFDIEPNGSPAKCCTISERLPEDVRILT